jgi:hypothetical protein
MDYAPDGKVRCLTWKALSATLRLVDAVIAEGSFGRWENAIMYNPSDNPVLKDGAFILKG